MFGSSQRNVQSENMIIVVFRFVMNVIMFTECGIYGMLLQV